MPTELPDDRRIGSWHDLLAEGILHSGVLHIFRRLARSYEWRPAARGAFPRVRHVANPKVVILCYHRVGAGGVPIYSALPTAVFEAQIRYLWRHYRIIPLAELGRELESGSGAGQSVVITFDDGYLGTYSEAFPVLRKYRVPATVYLTVGSVETGEIAWYDRIFLALQLCAQTTLELELDGSRCYHLSSAAARFRASLDIVYRLRELPDSYRRAFGRYFDQRFHLPREQVSGRMMTWQQVREMQQSGISFGCHSMTHPVISRLDAADLHYELLESKQLLEERIGQEVKDFAFPFGDGRDCSAEAVEALARFGYRSAVTTISGVNVPGVNPFLLRRSSIVEKRSLGRFAWMLSELFWQPGAGMAIEGMLAAGAHTATVLAGEGTKH